MLKGIDEATGRAGCRECTATRSPLASGEAQPDSFRQALLDLYDSYRGWNPGDQQKGPDGNGSEAHRWLMGSGVCPSEGVVLGDCLLSHADREAPAAVAVGVFGAAASQTVFVAGAHVVQVHGVLVGAGEAVRPAGCGVLGRGGDTVSALATGRGAAPGAAPG